MPAWIYDYVAPVIITGIIGAVSLFFKRMWTREKSLNDGMLALLHDRIYSECAKCEGKGYATVEEIRNIEYLYNPYHALGGNGTGTMLYERVKNLPEKPAE